MILSACGVDRQVIVDDYSKSRQGLVIEYDEVKDEMNDLGLDDEFAKTRPDVSVEGPAVNAWVARA